MTIENINFTSSLLDKKNIPTVKEESKTVTTPQKTEEKPDEFVSSTEENDEVQKKNNKVRNWAIGISSVVALAILAIAGRAGKLGKGIQKFLGGAKKEVEEVAGHSKPRVTETEEEITLEEFELIKNKDADFIAGSKDNVVVDEEPLVIHKPKQESVSVPKPEEPPLVKSDEVPAEVKAEPTANAEATSGSKVEGAIEAKTLTQKQAELNSVINRVPPQLNESLLHAEFPELEAWYKRFGINLEEIEKIDISKYKRFSSSEIQYEMKLPDGNCLRIHRAKAKPNEITYIGYSTTPLTNDYAISFKQGESKTDIHVEDFVNMTTYSYKNNGKKFNLNVCNKGNFSELSYDNDGNLRTLIENTDKDTGLHRKIYLYTGGNVQRIEHFGDNGYLKTDYFDENGKFVNEEFEQNLSW